MRSQSPEEITLFSQPGKGEVEQIITENQPGRVKFQATYWPARLYNPNYEVTLLPETPVVVIGRQGITLLVVPVSEPQENNLEAEGEIKEKANTFNPLNWTQKFGSLFGFRLN